MEKNEWKINNIWMKILFTLGAISGITFVISFAYGFITVLLTP